MSRSSPRESSFMLAGNFSLSASHVAHYSPDTGLLISLIAIVGFAPLLEGGTTHLAMMILRLLVLLGAAFVLAKIFHDSPLLDRPTPVTMPILLFLILGAGSTMVSPYQSQSVQWLTILTVYAVTLYLFLHSFMSWPHVWKCAVAILLLGCVEALWAWNEWFMFGMNRPNGSFFNANFFGGFEAAVSVLVISAVSYVPWKRYSAQCRAKERLYAIAVGSLALVMVGSMLLAGSRGAFLAFVLGLAVAIGIRWGWKGAGVVIGLGAILALIPTPFRERVLAEHGANPESYARYHMWLSAAREMLDHPFGVGLGLYQYTYPQYAFPVEGEIARYGKLAFTPHNEYLQMGVELGIFGVGIFIWGLALVGREAIRGLRARLTRHQRGLLTGVIGGSVVILAQAAVDSPLHEPGIVFVFIAFVATILSWRCWLGSSRCVVSRVGVRNPRAWMIGGGVVWCLLLVQVMRLGWGYLAYEASMTQRALNNSAQAIYYLNWAVRLDSGKSLYHRELGAAHYREYADSSDVRSLRVALDELQIAIQLNPLDGHLQAVLGGVYAKLYRAGVASQLSMTEEELAGASMAAYRSASKLQPYMYAHRYELGLLHETLRQVREAQHQYDALLELEPNFLPARERLARLSLQAGDVVRATVQCEEIIQRQRKYQAYSYDPNANLFMNVNAALLEADIQKMSSGT